MNIVKFKTAKLLTKMFAIVLISSLTFVSMNAQDAVPEASAASLYNSGLALLKEKNFADGYTKMMEAKEKAKEKGDEKIIRLANKNGAVAAYSAGNGLLKAKDYDGAMTYYMAGAELNPKYSSNFIGQGKVHNAKGEKVMAIESYLAGADIAKENGKDKKVTDAYKRAKSVVTKFYGAKKYAEAIEVGKLYVAKDDNADVLYYMARAYGETGNHADALTSAEKAIEVGTAAGTLEDKYVFAKGLALEGLNKKSEAIQAYKLVGDGDYKEQADYKIGKLSGK